MPTELGGHEELIRCLYYTQEVRDRYGIQIDTAMIDDVPGYTWALPELFVEAGIPRVSFRANSIRGQFLWYRPGAVPRPCWWEGPDGSRLFMWYTDSYREGNFWRNPGLQEDRFLEVIQRNEEAGCKVDHIQLRMGGDNLAPDLDVSVNARAWGEKYLWPEVRVATNRAFLETLEDKYGDECPVVRGDIPSWWAEGPGSSAYETGINRLVHDQLTGVEALWTIACLADRNRKYPKPAIAAAYDNMIHFDEHVWGASEAVSRPRDESTIFQWNFKARYAHTAKNLADDLEHHALQILSESIPSPKARSIAVWNTLAWKRSDVVEVSLVEQQLDRTTGIRVIDTRSNQIVNVQLSQDGEKTWFVARDVPAMGYAVFVIEPIEDMLPKDRGEPSVLESDDYRIVVSPASGGWTSWYDKRLGRELLDQTATYRGNQPIYETPIGDRDTINKKEPVQFNRTAATAGTLISQSTGDVFAEMTFEAQLPRCPQIRQTVRVYHDLKAVDVTNTVVKDEVFEPEAVYFAFPFDIPEPEFHVQIADAVMRPGKDQLPLTCYDFYSIQQWADVSGDGCGVILAPLEAPLVTISDLNVYQWADKMSFDKGHLYSFALNNYWFTNFKAGQFGTIPFRYRLTSYKGDHDPIRATRFAWQPFHPLKSVWLEPNRSPDSPLPGSFIETEGDEVIVSCVKMAEKGRDVIVRLLEMRSRPARCKVKLALPDGRPIVEAHMADVVERFQKRLPVEDGMVEVQLRPNEVYTLRLTPGAF
jgi:hypothetical protein